MSEEKIIAAAVQRVRERHEAASVAYKRRQQAAEALASAHHEKWLADAALADAERTVVALARGRTPEATGHCVAIEDKLFAGATIREASGFPFRGLQQSTERLAKEAIFAMEAIDNP